MLRQLLAKKTLNRALQSFSAASFNTGLFVRQARFFAEDSRINISDEGSDPDFQSDTKIDTAEGKEAEVLAEIEKVEGYNNPRS